MQIALRFWVFFHLPTPPGVSPGVWSVPVRWLPALSGIQRKGMWQTLRSWTEEESWDTGEEISAAAQRRAH